MAIDATGNAIGVLIAEDEPHVRAALVELVGSDAALALVGVAGDAATAVELSRALRPDVAVVDVKMPHGGGVAAASGIRSVSPATAVIALSAYDDDGARSAMLDAGAVGYLIKGGDVEELLAAIRAAAVRKP